VITNDQRLRAVFPPNLGWLECNLTQQEIDYVWGCVKNKKENYKSSLAGYIDSSFVLEDKYNWFFNNTLIDLIQAYGDQFDNLGRKIPLVKNYTYRLHDWWVNYQKQHEFNPFHSHSGIYSFVIWLKIPTRYEEQKKLDISNGANSECISNFTFTYKDILGGDKMDHYEMSPEMEGKMLFFPSNLSHQVYPFYNCKEERISVSGNIWIDDT
jgi:hypothetical protein